MFSVRPRVLCRLGEDETGGSVFFLKRGCKRERAVRNEGRDDGFDVEGAGGVLDTDVDNGDGRDEGGTEDAADGSCADIDRDAGRVAAMGEMEGRWDVAGMSDVGLFGVGGAASRRAANKEGDNC